MSVFVSQYTVFFVFNAALAIGGIARVGQVVLLQPFVIVALALPVNGEPINVETIVLLPPVVATVLIWTADARGAVRSNSASSAEKQPGRSRRFR